MKRVVKQSDSIESGQVSWIKSFGSVAALLGPLIGKGLKSLVDMGVQYEKMQQDKESKILKFDVITPEGTKFKCQCIPVEGADGVYNMVFETKGGTSKTYESIKEDKFDDTIAKFIKESLHENLQKDNQKKEQEGSNMNKDENNNENKEVNESSRIRVSLRKVTASSGSTVECTSVETNLVPSEAYSAISDVCGDDEFCNNLSETPATFDIIEVDDGYDVNPVDEAPSTIETYEVLVLATYSCMLNLQNLHWNVKGPQFMRVHTMLSDYVYKLIQDIDTLAEIGLQNSASIKSPADIVKNVVNVCPAGNIEVPAAIGIAISVVKGYLDALELYYPNLPHEVQSILDEWISFWKAEIDYKLARMA